MKMKLVVSIAAALAPLLLAESLAAAEKLRALIIDGQNNHDWKATTPVLKWILEDSGRFAVEVFTTPPGAPSRPARPQGELSEKQQADYQAATTAWNRAQRDLSRINQLRWQQQPPRFQDYAVVVLNYNGDAWPSEIREQFAGYVRNGGGVVVVHAADNSFPEWPEFNEIIGVGGWGGRNEKSGPMLYWQEGRIVRDTSPGAGGTHGAQHEFVVEARAPEHPILMGLPPKWKNATDELYSRLRGPATNLTVLATAFADPAKGGTGKHEPVLMTINYGKGHVFHTALGHGTQTMSGRGFQITLQRGAEWAATGKVTLPDPKPEDMPDDKVVLRPKP